MAPHGHTEAQQQACTRWRVAAARQVDQWLEFAGSLAPGSALEAACAVANEYLQLRTYLVGYRLSLADLACWGQLAGMPSGQGPQDSILQAR